MPGVKLKSFSLHYRLVFPPFEFYIEHFVPIITKFIYWITPSPS